VIARRRWHTESLEQRHEIDCRHRAREGFDMSSHLGDMRHASIAGRKARVGLELGWPIAANTPRRIVRSARRSRRGRRPTRRCQRSQTRNDAACPLGQTAGLEQVEGFGGDQGRQHAEHRYVHVLTHASHLALPQRGQNTDDRKHWGE
jgi:hypothetical protein